MKNYRGKNGTVYTFKVTGRKSGNVWGGNNNIYTDDSDIATAAVHAGAVKDGQTTTIKVKVIAGQSSYTGSTRNGVTSNNWGKYDGSFQIMTENTGGNTGGTSSGQNTSTAQNAPNNMKNYRGKNGTVYTFKVTGRKSGNVWGGNNNIYTDDSDIATAAVHAGVVKVGQTATIKVKVMAGQSSYTGSTRNGITSSNWGKYDGSYYISK